MSLRENRIKEILSKALEPLHLEVENESHMHSVPANSETHFKVLAVSKKFEGLSRIDRQRLINSLLQEELKSGLHALTQKTMTPAEWEAQKEKLNFESPECLGGSKHDRK